MQISLMAPARPAIRFSNSQGRADEDAKVADEV